MLQSRERGVIVRRRGREIVRSEGKTGSLMRHVEYLGSEGSVCEVMHSKRSERQL